MRIIKGHYKGFVFKPYKHSNTRPTTELSKKILFDTLENNINISGLKVLDLFSGTGNIGLEFLSRDCLHVTSVDLDSRNIKYISDIKSSLKIKNWDIIKRDALDYIKNFKDFDLIFADPPYDYPQIHEFVSEVLNTDLTQFFVFEHAKRIVLNHEQLFLKKEIGDSCLSFFKF